MLILTRKKQAKLAGYLLSLLSRTEKLTDEKSINNRAKMETKIVDDLYKMADIVLGPHGVEKLLAIRELNLSRGINFDKEE